MQNVEQTIISQYANSPRLVALITGLNGYIDPSVDFDLFYNAVMNIDTATTWGLQVWGRRVGVSSVVQVPITPLDFGFAEDGTFNAVGFAETVSSGTSHFWDGISPLTQPYTLSDDEYRTLILAKALYNITDCSIPAINQILLNLFPGRGNCYVVDNLNMTMSYQFSFAITSVENAILSQSGVLPKPTGVLATVTMV